VEVINEDYNDFVSLSTKLVNVDGAVLRMKKPLLELRVSAPPPLTLPTHTRRHTYAAIHRHMRSPANSSRHTYSRAATHTHTHTLTQLGT
jgi:hypothetical protein